MNVVLEGQLSQKWGMREVLQSVAQLDLIETGILRINAAGDGMSGRLSFARGRYITGGLISDSGGSGYPAVRALLSVGEGNFAFLDTGGADPVDIDQSLNISVSKILSLLPSLPEDSAGLFDEEALLDRVFGAESAAAPMLSPAEDSGAHNPLASKPDTAGSWQALAPLILDATPPPDHGPLLKTSQTGMPRLDDGRITYSKLKSIASRRVCQFPALAWAGIILVVLAVAALLYSSMSERGHDDRRGTVDGGRR